MKDLAKFLYIFIIGILVVQPGDVLGSVKLSHLSTVYLPNKDDKLEFGGGAVEQLALDPIRKLVYVAGYRVFHVIDASDPNNLRKEYTKYEQDKLDFTDIEVCRDHVFMTVHNKEDPDKSVLRVYKSYHRTRDPPMELVKEYFVGSLPDMLYVLSNCRTVIIADEGDTYKWNGKFVDPEGHITIVQFPDAIDKSTDNAKVTLLGFNNYNDRYQEMKPSGVRFIYTKGKLSNDLEPAYVAVDEEIDMAYVVLQENNAIAEVDLLTLNITNIRGLGYKEWGGLDPSDRDGGVRITYWPIRAWYAPDGTVYYRWQGRNLLFTANEGAVREYSEVNFDELIKGEDIDKDDVTDDVHHMVKSALDNKDRLGRLKFSRYDGKDSSGKYHALYTIGGRSFSIWDVTSGLGKDTSALPRLFDSGSQIEELTALHCPHLFNRDEDVVDGRSDNMGPEPESLALGEIDGRLYIFIGNERPGTIFVYSLGHDDCFQPRFETIFCEGIPEGNKSMKDMFDDRQIYGVDNEDVRFYPASKSPTGRPVLMVAGTVSGTVTLLNVQVSGN